jgi:hypothetical protein
MYPNYGDTATGHDEDKEAGELKMKRHQMSPLMMTFIRPSLMQTEKQKVQTRTGS